MATCINATAQGRRTRSSCICYQRLVRFFHRFQITMHFSITSFLAFAAGFSFCLATPYGDLPETAVMTFISASPGPSYSVEIALDGQTQYTCSSSQFPPPCAFYPKLLTLSKADNTQSISSISSPDFDVAANCHLTTIAGTYTLVEIGYNYWNLGPPQVVTAISCSQAPLDEKEKRNRPEAGVEFYGAAGAVYGLAVAYDGSAYVVPSKSVH